MFGSWIATVILLFLIWKYLVKKERKDLQNGPDDDGESIFSDDMTEFQMAVAFISSGKCRLSDAAKLALYGLYKQATVGNNTTPAPAAIDIVGSAKWKSWNSYANLSTEEAEAKYVDFVTKLVPQWKEADNVEKLETTETDVSSSSSGFGIAVSKMSYEQEEMDESAMDVFAHCAAGHTDFVLQFISEKPNFMNQGDECGRTLLHWACDKGNLELVKELLKQGADMLVKDSEDMIPLDYACVCEEREIIDYMIAHGARLEDCQPESLEFLEWSVC